MSKKFSSSKPVQVTRSTLPPVNEYLEKVREVLESGWLTNHGPREQELESSLREYLKVPAMYLCVNGTMAIQLALRALGLNGKKIITTPYTYVATLSAILWEGCEAVFADIDPDTLCINPEEVEKCLQSHPDAAAIVGVDVYGNSCDVHTLEKIAKKHGLKVIYDVAHGFGSLLDGRSLFAYGDAATGSFHATKLFHTIEGGCIASSCEIREQLRLVGAFGHIGEEHFTLGINAKMTEVHAAMGLCLLPYVSEIIEKREHICKLYDRILNLDESCGLRRPKLAPGLQWNYAYYPVIFRDEKTLLQCIDAIKANNINPRRYFYPSLTQLPYVSSPPCPVSDSIAKRALCLPLWPDMDEDIVKLTAAAIMKIL